MSSSFTVDIPSGSTLPITIGGDGPAVQIDSDVKLDTDSKIDVKPLHIDTDAKIDLKPVHVDTDSKIDLKPVAVDSCTTIKLAPLPPIHVEQPYSTHFGFTYMGMELFGFTMSGKSGTFLSSPPKPQYHSMPMAEPHRPSEDAGAESRPGRPSSGLRVRVNEK